MKPKKTQDKSSEHDKVHTDLTYVQKQSDAVYTGTNSKKESAKDVKVDSNTKTVKNQSNADTVDTKKQSDAVLNTGHSILKHTESKPSLTNKVNSDSANVKNQSRAVLNQDKFTGKNIKSESKQAIKVSAISKTVNQLNAVLTVGDSKVTESKHVQDYKIPDEKDVKKPSYVVLRDANEFHPTENKSSQDNAVDLNIIDLEKPSDRVFKDSDDSKPIESKSILVNKIDLDTTDVKKPFVAVLIEADDSKPTKSKTSRDKNVDIDTTAEVKKISDAVLNDADFSKPIESKTGVDNIVDLDKTDVKKASGAIIQDADDSKPTESKPGQNKNVDLDTTAEVKKPSDAVLKDADVSKQTESNNGVDNIVGLDKNDVEKSSYAVLKDADDFKPTESKPSQDIKVELDTTTEVKKPSDAVIMESNVFKPIKSKTSQAIQIDLDTTAEVKKTSDAVLKDVDVSKPIESKTGQAIQRDLDTIAEVKKPSDGVLMNANISRSIKSKTSQVIHRDLDTIAEVNKTSNAIFKDADVSKPIQSKTSQAIHRNIYIYEVKKSSDAVLKNVDVSKPIESKTGPEIQTGLDTIAEVNKPSDAVLKNADVSKPIKSKTSQAIQRDLDTIDEVKKPSDAVSKDAVDSKLTESKPDLEKTDVNKPSDAVLKDGDDIKPTEIKTGQEKTVELDTTAEVKTPSDAVLKDADTSKLTESKTGQDIQKGLDTKAEVKKSSGVVLKDAGVSKLTESKTSQDINRGLDIIDEVKKPSVAVLMDEDVSAPTKSKTGQDIQEGLNTIGEVKKPPGVVLKDADVSKLTEIKTSQDIKRGLDTIVELKKPSDAVLKDADVPKSTESKTGQDIKKSLDTIAEVKKPSDAVLKDADDSKPTESKTGQDIQRDLDTIAEVKKPSDAGLTGADESKLTESKPGQYDKVVLDTVEAKKLSGAVLVYSEQKREKKLTVSERIKESKCKKIIVNAFKSLTKKKKTEKEKFKHEVMGIIKDEEKVENLDERKDEEKGENKGEEQYEGKGEGQSEEKVKEGAPTQDEKAELDTTGEKKLSDAVSEEVQKDVQLLPDLKKKRKYFKCPKYFLNKIKKVKETVKKEMLEEPDQEEEKEDEKGLKEKKKKAGSEENEWFIQQYEKYIGKRKRIEVDPASLMRELKFKARTRFTPESLFYRPRKPKAGESLFLSWDGPYVPRCGCPLRECFCRGDTQLTTNVELKFCAFVTRECRLTWRRCTSKIPCKRKANAKALYETLSKRIRNEARYYKKVQRLKKLHKLNPEFCFEQCYHCDHPDERKLQNIQFLPWFMYEDQVDDEDEDGDIDFDEEEEEEPEPEPEPGPEPEPEPEKEPEPEPEPEREPEEEPEPEPEPEPVPLVEKPPDSDVEDDDRVCDVFTNTCTVSSQIDPLSEDGEFILPKWLRRKNSRVLYPSVNKSIFRNIEGNEIVICPYEGPRDYEVCDVAISDGEAYTFDARMKVCAAKIEAFSFKDFKNRFTKFLSYILEVKESTVPVNTKYTQLPCRGVICDANDDCAIGYSLHNKGSKDYMCGEVDYDFLPELPYMDQFDESDIREAYAKRDSDPCPCCKMYSRNRSRQAYDECVARKQVIITPRKYACEKLPDLTQRISETDVEPQTPTNVRSQNERDKKLGETSKTDITGVNKPLNSNVGIKSEGSETMPSTSKNKQGMINEGQLEPLKNSDVSNLISSVMDTTPAPKQSTRKPQEKCDFLNNTNVINQLSGSKTNIKLSFTKMELKSGSDFRNVPLNVITEDRSHSTITDRSDESNVTLVAKIMGSGDTLDKISPTPSNNSVDASDSNTPSVLNSLFNWIFNPKSNLNNRSNSSAVKLQEKISSKVLKISPKELKISSKDLKKSTNDLKTISKENSPDGTKITVKDSDISEKELFSLQYSSTRSVPIASSTRKTGSSISSKLSCMKTLNNM